MPSDTWESEAAMSAALVEHLKRDGWVVHQEVVFKVGTADMVATRDQEIWVFEAKLRFNNEVIEQAFRWLPYAHHVSIVIPHNPWKRRGSKRKLNGSSPFMERLMRHHGVSVIHMDAWRKGPYGEWTEFERWKMNMYETASPAKIHELRESLNPRQVSGEFAAAGQNKGKRWTPWKQFASDLLEYVTKHPGKTLKYLSTNMKHCYRSDKGFIYRTPKLIDRGALPGISYDGTGVAGKLYPVQRTVEGKRRNK